MKKLLLPGLITMIIIAHSCRKDGSSHTPLIGKWQLVNSAGGFAGTYRNYGPDSVYILQLHNDSTYTRQFNGAIYGSGKYHTAILPQINRNDTLILFEQNHDMLWQFMQRQNGKLYTSDIVADGFTNTYKKVI